MKILKRLPKASREFSAKKFAAILDAVVTKNDPASWDRLLRFNTRCLRQPRRGRRIIHPSLFYLDDGTLGGSVVDLKHDLEVVEYEGAEIGLHLNRHKSEIICSNADITGTILPSLPGAQVVDPARATLLVSSIGDVSSISDILTSKINMLKRMGDRLPIFLRP